MTETEIQNILEKQHKFFQTGQTLPVNYRIEQLKKLKDSIIRHEPDLNLALKADLGKSETESYMCEVGLTLSELSWMLKHIKKLTKEKWVPTPLAQFAAKSFRSPSPYGTVLIMSPWNYPVLLTLEPLIDALAAGNTAVVKPSAYAPATSRVMQEIIEECFSEEYVAVVTGGRAENQALLNQRFDKIFFTGGKTVGREVLRRIPNTGHTGAWWQKPMYRGFHSQDSTCRKTYRFWKILKLRTDLCCSGLYPLRQSHS